MVNWGTSVTIVRRMRWIHCARDALGVAIKEQRHDLLGERVVEIGAVHAVLLGDVVGMGIFADGEAIGAVIAFAPPAVQDAQAHAAVAAGFHAAGAGGLERRRGLFSQMSQPETIWRATWMS